MRTTTRAARVQFTYQQDEFVAMLHDVLPTAGRRFEQLMYFVLPCLLWGLVIYAATTLALT